MLKNKGVNIYQSKSSIQICRFGTGLLSEMENLKVFDYFDMVYFQFDQTSTICQLCFGRSRRFEPPGP